MDRPRFVRWAFDRYLDIAPPEFALEGGLAAPRSRRAALAWTSQRSVADDEHDADRQQRDPGQLGRR